MSSHSDRVAFVLSGGASLGAVQAGMLRALYERGIAPDLIVGTSVGAINGAFIASRPPAVETADELAEIWRCVRRGQVFALRPVSGLLGFVGSRDHLVPESGLRRLIAEHTAYDRLEQTPMSFTSSRSTCSRARNCCSHAVPCSKRSWRARRFPLSCPRLPGRAAR
jgi:predicted acylesterase/phospholipase RssA